MLKGLHQIIWAKVALLWLITGSSGALASAEDIVLLLSSENSVYQTTINKLRGESDQSVRFTTITLNDSNRMPLTFLESSDLVITFGARAANYAAQQNLLRKTVFSYLTHEQYLSLDFQRPAAVVLLDQPLRRYLALSQVLIENARIGTLVSDGNGLEYLQDSDAIEGLQIIRQTTARRLLGNLRNLLNDIDIFLMTPNTELYNRNSLRGILLTTYRTRKPVISFSPAHVKSGALGSIYSSPADIGKHLSELVRELPSMAGSDRPEIELARYYSVTTNSKVARSLGILLPDEDTILQRLREILDQ